MKSGIGTGILGAGVWLIACQGLNAAPRDVQNAEVLRQQTQTYTGSAQAIQQNLTGPLMTQDPMSTFNGTTFNAQIGCQSQSAYLELLIQPGPTGDLQNMTFQQDTTLDGQFDRVWTPGLHASGVCANGLVSCDPGTWDHCQAYQWTVLQNNELALQHVPLTRLGGCYCVNNHCGNQLVWNNLSNVLGDLGGGAASALAASNPYYAITDVTVSGPVIRYSGQKTGGCAQGPANLHRYTATPGDLTSDAFASAPANPLYQLVSTSPVATQDHSTLAQCEIRRSVTLNETTLSQIIDYDSGSGAVTPCGPDCLQLTLGQVGDNYWQGACSYFEHNAAFNVLQPERILSATLVRAKWDDWMQVRVNQDLIWNGPFGTWTGPGPVPGACELSTSWDMQPGVDFTPHLKQAGPVNFNIRVEVTEGGEGYAYARIQVDTDCHLNPEVIADQCGAYQQNPDCDLVTETVDNVLTFDRGIATGLTPLTQTLTLMGSSCSFAVERDWFSKERTYRCRSQNPWDLDEALQRKAFVTQNTTPTQYLDRVIDARTGEAVTSTGALQTLNEVTVAPCVQVCKVRKPRLANDVARSGLVADHRNSDMTWAIAYPECENNLCPLEAGDELLKDCDCLNEWAEAASIMQMMRLAGSDIVCSSGNPAAIQ